MIDMVNKWFNYFNNNRNLWISLYTEKKRLFPEFCNINKISEIALQENIDNWILQLVK